MFLFSCDREIENIFIWRFTLFGISGNADTQAQIFSTPPQSFSPLLGI